MICRECNRKLEEHTPRLEVVHRDGSKATWCAPCCASASYAGQPWNQVQHEAFNAARGVHP